MIGYFRLINPVFQHNCCDLSMLKMLPNRPEACNLLKGKLKYFLQFATRLKSVALVWAIAPPQTPCTGSSERCSGEVQPKMQYQGKDLARILQLTKRPIEVRNLAGYTLTALSVHEVFQHVNLRAYVGVGNPQRIRYLRPLNNDDTRSFPISCSSTTQRPKNQNGAYIGHCKTREHKKLRGLL